MQIENPITNEMKEWKRMVACHKSPAFSLKCGHLGRIGRGATHPLTSVLPNNGNNLLCKWDYYLLIDEKIDCLGRLRGGAGAEGSRWRLIDRERK